VAQIELLQPTEKIKDSYGKINTSLTNLNNNKLEKSGDTMTGPLTMTAQNSNPNAYSQPIYMKYVDSGGTERSAYLQTHPTGKLIFRDGVNDGELTFWHDGNNPASVAANGYQVLASGLIVQWGFATVAGNNVGTPITYPITFPNVVANVLTVPRANIGVAASPENPTTSGFTCYQGHSTDLTVHWIAIGW